MRCIKIIVLQEYINGLIVLLKIEFDEKLLYVGLQGSYLRNETTDISDIDIMVVIDKLEICDLDKYKNILMEIGNYDKSCGFICGKDELLNWNPLEICSLIHSTKDYYKTLSNLVPKYSNSDIKNFIKLSLNNLYHQLCHNYIHSNKKENISELPLIYKNTFFILQNLYYLRQGEFFSTKKDMLKFAYPKDKTILENLMHLNECKEYDFEKMFSDIFLWCKQLMIEL